MKTKILVVEDDLLTLKFLDFILKKNNFDIVVSKDGADAIERFIKINPDLVITDIMLPYKSGLEFAQYVKSVSPHTPIVVLSSLGEEESTIQKAFEFKVDDFISKPFSPNELVLRIKRLLE